MGPCLHGEVQLYLGCGEWLEFKLVKRKGESISGEMSKNVEMGIVMDRKHGALMGKLVKSKIYTILGVA